MKTLLLLMLFSITAYSAPPEHASNPDADEMPEQANCVFCDEPEEVEEDEAPIDIDFADFALGCGFAVLLMSIYKPKKESDEQRDKV